MNLNRNRVLRCALTLFVGAIVMSLGKKQSNVSLELFMFAMKLAIVSFVIYFSMNDEKKN